MKQKIEREQFEAWLFSQPLDRVIEASSTTRCFICSFFWETMRKHVNAYTDDYIVKDDMFQEWDSVPIPIWLIELLGDSINGHANLVTAGEMQTRYRKMFPETIHENESETAGLLPDLPIGMAGRAESDRVPAVAG